MNRKIVNHHWHCKKHNSLIGEEYDCPYCIREKDIGRIVYSKTQGRIERLIRKISIKINFKKLGILSIRERKIINYRFGRKYHRFFTLQEIGNMLKCSRQRIYQIEQNALRKLKINNAKIETL